MLLSQVINSIPKEASISAQYQIVSHIHKNYKLLKDIPNARESADFVLVDTQLPPPVLINTKILNNYLDGLDKNSQYKLIVNQGGIVLFKKISSKF